MKRLVVVSAAMLALVACGADRPARVNYAMSPDFGDTRVTPLPAAELAASDGSLPIAPEDQLFFTFDSVELDAEARGLLTEVATWVRRDRSRQILIQGHADSSGDADYNLDLSSRRAHAVATYLRSLGVRDEQFAVVAVGESAASLEPNAVNRRVAIYATSPHVASN